MFDKMSSRLTERCANEVLKRLSEITSNANYIALVEHESVITCTVRYIRPTKKSSTKENWAQKESWLKCVGDLVTHLLRISRDTTRACISLYPSALSSVFRLLAVGD